VLGHIRNARIFWVNSLFLLYLAAQAPFASSADSMSPGLSPFETCQIKSLDGPAQRSAECATFTVAENPDAPQGTQIELYVARIASLSPAPAPDPLVLIAGGPGGSTVDMYLGLVRAFSGVLDERDILLLDQRGTGRSALLDCPMEMEDSIQAELTPEDAKAAANDCLQQLDRDPRYYTTSVAVQDLEALRVAAGYEQLNVYGVSYGSRVAQHFLRRYPDSTRTLIIDGVVPPTRALGPDIALNAQLTLDGIFNRCASQTHCATAFPDLPNSFSELSRTLRSNPPTVTYADPVTGVHEELTLQYGAMAVLTRLLTYAPETAAIIPYTLQQAANGHYESLTSQAVGTLTTLSSSLSAGMHNSVICAEDIPHLGPIDTQALDQTYLGSDQVAALKAICEVWPRGVADADFKEPLQSDKPVLLLSGQFDPITPPAYAKEAQKSLSNSHHFIAPGQGHSVIARGCIPRVVAHFVAEADIASTLETEDGCIDRLRAMAFFVNSMGPDPEPSDEQAQAEQ